MLPTVDESRGYNFLDPENADKWRGLYVNSLRKVLEQVYPSLGVSDAALEYVESLCLRLLALLVAPPSPLTVTDVEERVARTFPNPVDKWALREARDTISRRRKTLMPADRLHHLLLKEVLLYKVDGSVTLFITGVIEYISADILKLAGSFVMKMTHKSGCARITCSDIQTAMYADKVLMDMFYQEEEAASTSGAGPSAARRGSLSYSELVRELLADERHYLRDLNLIIRVFKDEVDKLLDDNKILAMIFGNIVDIYELTVTLLGNLEDACEMSQDASTPFIGSCFEELAEVEEFRAYVRYANIITRPQSRAALMEVALRADAGSRLETAGHGFRLAVQFYLPKLLMIPVAHIFLYHNYVLALLQIASDSEDRESFKQVECYLQPITKILQKALANGPKTEAALPMASRTRRQMAIEKCNELSRIIDNWDTRDLGQCCNEFIREDTLSKLGPGRRVAERRAYLFDGLLMLCKPQSSLVSASGVAGVGSCTGGPQLKLKERLYVRKLDVVDKPDTDDNKNLVELVPRCGPSVVLMCGSPAEKRNWMCDLVMLNTKPMLDRTLDSILLDMERRHPLKLPSPDIYRFALEDSPQNIILEQRTGMPPAIRGATLLKLIERLTYHIYADLVLVRTFLTTYRSFCQPRELLSLLRERFDIPDPSKVYDVAPGENMESLVATDAEKLNKSTAREDWKRYRKEFEQPVKFRVINVLRHWVDQHFYDFERDPELLEQLREFLESVDGRSMRRWVQSVLKTLARKSSGGNEEVGVAHVFDKAPPAIIKHPHSPDQYDWHPLTLHPLEFARQLTLLHFHLYRLVRPSELVGAVWTKRDKEATSPNLLRMIKHSTNLTRWMEKCIVESDNLEERVAVLTRFLEIACLLRDLNNFNGVLAVVAATGSAAVHRLRATHQLLSPRLVRALEQLRSLNSDHFKRYQERLRSINPPCVPFLGIYLTNILHIEEGNLDYLPNTQLINFSKRRMVAEITGEIQQYQNQPYCLTVEPVTRAFLENLDPFPGMDDTTITNYLYNKSLEIEPRNRDKPLPKFPRKYPDLSLKTLKIRRQTVESHASTGTSTIISTSASTSASASASNDDNASVSQLSPPGVWDGGSVCSLPLLHEDRKHEAPSPRMERSSHTFSIFDKGRTLFSSARHSSSTSPRSDTASNDHHNDGHHRSQSVCSNTVSPAVTRELTPRSAIVDASSFYLTRQQDRIPLLGRNSFSSSTSATISAGTSSTTISTTISSDVQEPAADAPPELPPRASENPTGLSATSTLNTNTWSASPHSNQDSAFKMSGASPKKSPIAGPSNAAAVTSGSHANQSSSGDVGTPPPLPPRRRRDSAPPAPPAPPAHTSTLRPMTPKHNQNAPLEIGAQSSEPPPLPPRPLPAPELLRPRDSTILQRRHHSGSSSSVSSSGSGAPKLPPKPSPSTGNSRT